MSVSQYLTWSGPMSAVIMVVIQLVFVAALAIFIWAKDIRGSGSASHQ